MTPPPPRRRDAPLLAILVGAAVLAGVVALSLISQLPGPRAPGVLRQMLVLHGALAGHSAPRGGPGDGPSRHVRSELDGTHIDSWLYDLGGDAATAHRFEAPPPLPRNAQDLPAPGGPVQAADFDSATALCWTGPDGAWCVVGDQPVAKLKELVRRIRDAPPPRPEEAG